MVLLAEAFVSGAIEEHITRMAIVAKTDSDAILLVALSMNVLYINT